MFGLLRSSPKSPNYKRPPLRDSNGFHSPSGREIETEHEKKSPRSYFKCATSFFFCTVFVLTAVASVISIILYVNCSNAVGFEIIPKSHQLCHDLYQFLQTGRIPAFTWDYKASFDEILRIIQQCFTGTFGWFKNFDPTALKDSIVAGFLACKDAVFGFPGWSYQNGGQVVQLLWKLFLEYCGVVWSYFTWAFYGFLHVLILAFDWCKVSVADMFDHISAHWQKIVEQVKN